MDFKLYNFLSILSLTAVFFVWRHWDGKRGACHYNSHDLTISISLLTWNGDHVCFFGVRLRRIEKGNHFNRAETISRNVQPSVLCGEWLWTFFKDRDLLKDNTWTRRLRDRERKTVGDDFDRREHSVFSSWPQIEPVMKVMKARAPKHCTWLMTETFTSVSKQWFEKILSLWSGQLFCGFSKLPLKVGLTSSVRVLKSDDLELSRASLYGLLL